MNTPREILLSEHRAQEPALEKQRRRFVAGLPSSPPQTIALARWLAIAWRELIVARRRSWLGLSAVWLIIGVLHVAQNDSPALARTTSSPFLPWKTLETEGIFYAFGNPTGIWSIEEASPPAKAPRTEPKPPGPRSDRPGDRFGRIPEADSDINGWG